MQEKSSLDFSERFAKALTAAEMRPSKLAEKAGVSKGYVSGLLAGVKNKPSIDTCKKFSEVLGCSLPWLFDGDEDASSVPQNPCNTRQVPVVGWAHAGEAASYDEIPKDWQDTVPTECRDTKAFAVRLEGDSMEPRYLEGDLLIVQPSEECYSGCLAVLKMTNDGILFRRIEKRGQDFRLVPLNPQYGVEEISGECITWIYPVWGVWRQVWRK